jgi:hypothetical protein
MALGEPLSVFGICPYLMESIKRKIKKKIYMFSYLMNLSTDSSNNFFVGWTLAGST